MINDSSKSVESHVPTVPRVYNSTQFDFDGFSFSMESRIPSLRSSHSPNFDENFDFCSQFPSIADPTSQVQTQLLTTDNVDNTSVNSEIVFATTENKSSSVRVDNTTYDASFSIDDRAVTVDGSIAQCRARRELKGPSYDTSVYTQHCGKKPKM